MNVQEIKLQYFLQHLEKGVQEVFERQSEAARSNIYSRGNDREEGRTGELRKALENPRYSVSTVGQGLQIVSTIPEYTRYVDMKKHGARNVYNKHVWGTLYRETLGDIKFSFRSWVRKNYGDALREILAAANATI